MLVRKDSYGGKNDRFVDLRKVKEALDRRGKASGSLTATMVGKKIERMPENVQHTLK